MEERNAEGKHNRKGFDFCSRIGWIGAWLHGGHGEKDKERYHGHGGTAKARKENDAAASNTTKEHTRGTRSSQR